MGVALALPDTRLVLDTDIFTAWRNQHPPVIAHIKDYKSRFLALPRLTAITVFESQFGFEKELAKPGELDERWLLSRQEMRRMIQACGVMDLNQQAAIVAAQIFARLPHNQQNRHWRDIFIAAIALTNGYGIATRNRKDFKLIGEHCPPDLPILYLADWK